MKMGSIRSGTQAAGIIFVLAIMVFMAGLWRTHWARSLQAAVAAPPPRPVLAASIGTGPTTIEVSDAVLHENVKRLGVNLGGQTFFDSLQTLKNLIVRNPGFEGQQWQSVLLCGTPGVNSCTGGANSSFWPEGFLDGGTYEVISGAAQGMRGTIVHSSVSNSHFGSTIQFSPSARTPAGGDYIVVRKFTPGDPTAGWGPQASGGATLTAEYKDLSPSTPGKQALRIDARGPGQYVALKSYFDTTDGRSFVQLRGPYTVRFRAKLVSGNSRMGVSMRRLWAGGTPMFSKNVDLDGQWRDYAFNFTADEPRQAVGGVMFTIQVEGAEVLLDDVSVEEATSNGTAFRTAAVAALQRLRPGVLRYMDSGQDFGADLDNMLAPASARDRTGWNLFLSKSEDTPLGLNDFLVLCEKIHAEPWYTIQIGWSEDEVRGLMEFLGGPVTTKYGAARAALGHPEPWTKTFPMIHLELGNETWNTAFPGGALPDPVAYGQRATTIFRVVRGSPWFGTGRFDLVVDGQVGDTYRTRTILDNAEGVDTIDIGPYQFNVFDDDSSTENVFGPMFAEPEMMDSSPDGFVPKQVKAAAKAKHPAKLAVYETNIDTVEGKVGQASLDLNVPSMGAGLAAMDHMLLMLRDDGITVQSTFQLGGGSYRFNNTAGLDKDERSPIWALVVDMGGATDRVRPEFLAQEMVNEAIRPTMLETRTSGTDPTWDQARSPNDGVELNGAHELQSFAFSDAQTNSLIVLNLSRSSAHDVVLSGLCSPHGLVTIKTLTSKKITDSNEHEDKVNVVSREERDVMPGKSKFTLLPFSMTVLSSSNQGCMPSAKASR
jgi:alpha-L-arabinofuranosidase